MDKPVSYYVSIIIALLALFGLSIFFALCETSFSSLSRIKLKNMAEKDKANKNPLVRRRAVRARLALKLLDAYDNLISSVLIGNTIVNVVTSALATLLCIQLFGARGVSIASVTVTAAVLIFGEISPKTLAKEYPELSALRATPLLRFFIFIFTPLNYLAAAWKKIIIKIFPVKTDRTVTEDELLTFVESVRKEGGINRQEEKMIRQAIEFDDLTAAEICVPRMDIAAIEENDSIQAINEKFAETGFSRLPVYQESIDKISGLMLLKDFHHEVINRGETPGSVVKPVVFVTKTIKISRLLQTMQKKRAHLAVVVDEFGGTLGIVTIEDILEELVGEIWDEHDEVEEAIIKTGDGSYRVRGNLTLPDMFEFINASQAANDPDTDESPELDIPNISVGSWALEKLGGLPKAGDQFSSLGVQLTVSKVYRHRVLEALVTVDKGQG
jgi:CBS domain containing-hemolysin-like protein